MKRRFLASLLVAVMIIQATTGIFMKPLTARANPATHLVISEVYGGGGNSGATLKNDFIEIYNPTESDISLDGWSVQYASASGTSWQVTNLSGSIAAHGYYLVQEAKGSGGTVDLPTPDAIGAISMSGTNGKVALVNSTADLTSADATGTSIVDFVGYGSAGTYEGSAAAPALTNSTSNHRKADGNLSPITSELIGNGQDTDHNGNDFTNDSPEPQNSASAKEPAMDPVDPPADTTAPVVVTKEPVEDAKTVGINKTVSITFDEVIFVETANLGSIIIKDSTGNAFENCTVQIDQKQLIINHPDFAYQTLYTVLIPADIIKDTAGNGTASIIWSFETKEEPIVVPPTEGDYQLYFGQLHSHTNLSDGQGTPEEAFAWAKDQGEADFFAVTDHSNWFDNDTANESIANPNDSTSSEWKRLNAVADQFTVDGEFIGIAGYEMTWTGGTGHINTFNTPWFVSRSNTSMNLKKYYDKLATAPNSFSQLNHPGTTFGDFNDFGFYSPEADAVIDLIEVGNGEGAIGSNGYFRSYEYYTKALDKGWHVAPSNNQDNHKAGWITANDARTVVLATELTRSSIYEAIKALRVYATEDKNLEINYEINDQVMGSILSDSTQLNFEIEAKDLDNAEQVGTISIISEGGTIVKQDTFTGSEAIWSFELSPQYAYYYVKVVEADGDIAVTAPIWTGEVKLVGLSKVEASQNPTLVGASIDLIATAYNNSTVSTSELLVEFYEGSVDGNKLGETTISNLAPGSTAEGKITWSALSAATYDIFAKTSIVEQGVPRVVIKSTQVKVLSSEDAVSVVIDGGHSNAYITGYYKNSYTGLLKTISKAGMLSTLNTDAITSSDLENANILILSDPESASASTKAVYSTEELSVIQNFVANGGSVIITSRADYGEANYGAEYQNSTQGNSVLGAIGSNLRFNDDEVWDDTSYDTYKYRLLLNHYESSKFGLTELYDGAKTFRIFSGCSLVAKESPELTNVEWLVKVHPTTTSLDSDNSSDAVSLAQGSFYVLAAETLSGGGKVVASGSTFFSDFEISASDNTFSNEEILTNILNWMGTKNDEGHQKTIAEVRMDLDGNNSPDLLGETVTIEGIVTSESEAMGNGNSFFGVVYVQDETGGITVFNVSNTKLPIGARVSITGKVELFEGDTEIQVINEAKDIQILDDQWSYVQPRSFSTSDSMLEENEGWLIQITGKVMEMTSNSLIVNDGSGNAKVYVNGYIGDGSGNSETLGKWDPTIQVGSTVTVVGLASEDAAGNRIRIRNTSEIRNLSGNQEIQFELIGRYQSTGENGLGIGVAEIVEYAPEVEKAYVVNGEAKSLDIIDLSELKNGQTYEDIAVEKSINLVSLLNTMQTGFVAGDITSIAVHPNNDYIAVTVQEADKTKKGRVVFLDMDGNYISLINVGYFPDCLTFSPDGNILVVANEAEPTDHYAQDPEGSVSLVDTSGTIQQITDAAVTDIGFEGVSKDQDVLLKVGSSATVDFEPEYITISDDNSTAYISLQENNAIAVLNLVTKQFTHVYSLGTKDFSITGLDASDKDKAIAIKTWPVLGLYMPDGISTFVKDGKTYLLTANEGDTREWGSYENSARVKDIKNLLDLKAENYEGLTQTQLDQLKGTYTTDANLGRLTIHSELGLNAEGKYETLYTFGGRSFSIWDTTDFSLVYDSREDFEQITALTNTTNFNCSNDNVKFDDRSDNKGPEPEGITLGVIGDQTYAFIGLERTGGLMVYNVTDPLQPKYVTYMNSRDFSSDISGDCGPEGITFIPATDSPTGTPLVLVANEISGTLAVYEISGEGIIPIEETNQIGVSIQALIDEVNLDQTTEVVFNIKGSNLVAMNALDMSLEFDQTNLKLKNIELYGDDGQVDYRVNNNTIRLIAGFTTPITSVVDQELVKLTFEIMNPSESVGQTYVAIESASSAASGVYQETIAIIENARAEITLFSIKERCDINGDGKTTISDLSIALDVYQASLSDENWDIKKKADVNLDGVVDVTDYTIIMLNILG